MAGANKSAKAGPEPDPPAKYEGVTRRLRLVKSAILESRSCLEKKSAKKKIGPILFSKKTPRSCSRFLPAKKEKSSKKGGNRADLASLKKSQKAHLPASQNELEGQGE